MGHHVNIEVKEESEYKMWIQRRRQPESAVVLNESDGLFLIINCQWTWAGEFYKRNCAYWMTCKISLSRPHTYIYSYK